jgi:hypothetical protein
LSRRADAWRAATLETSLYPPIKKFLEGLGFEAKGEIGGCDVVALKDESPPIVVITELKLTFTLELVLQGVDRIAACDEVWLAVRLASRGRERDARVRKLCRLLGFGLLGVTETGIVDILVDPSVWRPRRDPKRRSALVSEHRRRRGDPALGGGNRQPVMTAYRQAALTCAAHLASGPCRMRDVTAIVPEAPKILAGNVYGWFERTARGVYGLTEAGRAALLRWPQPGTTHGRHGEEHRDEAIHRGSL